MRKTKENTSTDQHAKKGVFDGLGLVDFAVGLVISVLNLPNGQELFFCEIQITEGLQSILPIKKGFGASWNDLWASTYASYSLPEWQAVKLTFFAPWLILLAQAFYTKTK